MKNISVTSFIHTIFILALLVVTLTFYILFSSTQEQRNIQRILRYKSITNSFLLQENLPKNGSKVKKLLKKQSLKVIPFSSVEKSIEKSGDTRLDANSIYGRVRVFKVKDSYYIYIERADYNLMLKDEHTIDYTTQLIFTIAVVLLLLILVLYIMLIKKLQPLQRLHKQIEQFASGDLNVKITYEGDDEIAKIAKSFDKAIKYIKQLISSKNLFMRNIMHELKTPITTSRIVADTVEDDMAKGILIRSFDRMNELIEDLAQIERITMYSFTPRKQNWLLSAIFEETEKMLLKDKKHYKFNFVDNIIYTDRALLALVLKNLIDNAIKYSNDSFATVDVVGNKIMVKSKGEKLKEDLSYYIEPFSQEEKRSAGFGLGLYIVANINEKLDYKFRYRYNKESQENIFEIVID